MLSEQNADLHQTVSFFPFPLLDISCQDSRAGAGLCWEVSLEQWARSCPLGDLCEENAKQMGSTSAKGTLG